MRKSHVAFGICLVVVLAAFVQADENDLFSQVRTESVFEPSSDAATPVPTRRANPIPELEIKIANTGELARKLRQAGFEVEEDAASRMVQTNVKLSQWSFPVLVVISEDESQLMMAVLLSSVANADQIPKNQLLELLQANRKYAPSSFGYSAKRKRAELYHTLPNQHVSSETLRSAIARLTKIAAETEELWDFSSSSSSSEQPAAKPAQETPAQTPVKTPAQASAPPSQISPALTGKWVATRSANEAFAIQFNGNGTFQLAYVNKSKQTRSSGKFTLAGQKLTLEGAGGFRLTGTIGSQSDKEFQLQLGDSATSTSNLVFKRAK